MARQSTIERALSSYGMWSDRDPDEFLRRSREGLVDRDQELLSTTRAQSL